MISSSVVLGGFNLSAGVEDQSTRVDVVQTIPHINYTRLRSGLRRNDIALLKLDNYTQSKFYKESIILKN